jgi:hypothetical protein
MSEIGSTTPMPHLTYLKTSNIEWQRKKAQPKMTQMSPR